MSVSPTNRLQGGGKSEVVYEPTFTVERVSRGHHWLFRFKPSTATETLRTMGNMAANADLDFSWYDAAVLSKCVRNIMAAWNMGKTKNQPGMGAE